MRVRSWVPLAALLVAGCGDGEDFTIEVKRPPAVVYAPLSAADVREARLVFPGIAIERRRPSEREILYTIPGTGDFPSTIRLQLEPTDRGEATVIHASVHVPPVRATIEGVDKVVSERKVETVLRNLLKSTARDLETGSSTESDTVKLSGFMVGIAIATNKAFLAKALEFKRSPEKLVDVLMPFDGYDDLPQSDRSERDRPMVDPDRADEQREIAQERADWQQQRAAEKAAAPADDLGGYDN